LTKFEKKEETVREHYLSPRSADKVHHPKRCGHRVAKCAVCVVVECKKKEQRRAKTLAVMHCDP
jgi:hypothetical protein